MNTLDNVRKGSTMVNTHSRNTRFRSLSTGLAASAALALLLTSPKSAVAQAYTITNLGSLGGDSKAFGLGANSTAAGTSVLADSTTTHAFLTRSGGTIQDLGTLGGVNSGGTAIADGALTQVVGYSDTGVGATQHAFLYTSGGVGGPAGNPQMRDLGTLSGVNTDNSTANGLNTLGQVVGDSTTSSATNGQTHAFRTGPNLNLNGTTDDLGTLGGIRSSANAVNISGQVVGNADRTDGNTHAFRSSANGAANSLTDLGTLGGTISDATAINASGQVVGQSDLASADPNAVSRHAFVWTQGATNGVAGNMQMTDLGSLGGDSQANGINDAGSIVGFSLLADGTTFDAFLYQNNQMVDLNSLIDPNSGWVLQYASAINNNGQIAGYGLFNVGVTQLT